MKKYLVVAWWAMGLLVAAGCRMQSDRRSVALPAGDQSHAPVIVEATQPPASNAQESAPGASLPGPTDAVGPPTQAGKPHRFDLARLQQFYREDLPSPRRLEGLLGCLREELADPSTPAMGPGGGPIDTWKIRGIIAASIGEVVDASDIARARDAETDDGLRQMLTVALGLAGDRGTVSELVEILHHHPDGCMRENAAYALYRLKANVPRAVLQARMSDRYAGLDVQDVGPPGISKVYPVREAVAALLRASGEKVDRRAYVQERPSTPIPEALSWLFEDKDPQVCLTTAQVLGQYGQEGLSYLRAFVEQNEGDETLKEAVEEARRILEAAETREDSASAPSAPAARADQ